MKVIGYARTTIIDKESSEQLNKLKEFGCTELFHETYAYEENCDNHSLESVIARMQSGETLVVSELHRLGKTTRQLTELTDLLRKRNLHLVSLAENIDTREPMGAIYFNLMEGLAAMEQALIKERTLVGLNNARKNGKIGDVQKSIQKPSKKFASFITIKKRRFNSSPQNAVFLSEPAINT